MREVSRKTQWSHAKNKPCAGQVSAWEGSGSVILLFSLYEHSADAERIGGDSFQIETHQYITIKYIESELKYTEII